MRTMCIYLLVMGKLGMCCMLVLGRIVSSNHIYMCGYILHVVKNAVIAQFLMDVFCL